MPAWLGVFSIIILVWGLLSIILGLVKGFMNKAVRIIKNLLVLPYAENEEVYADVTSYLDEAEQFVKGETK